MNEVSNQIIISQGDSDGKSWFHMTLSYSFATSETKDKTILKILDVLRASEAA